MVLVWNPLALPSVAAGVIALAMAAFVLSVGAGRRTNRLLAAVLTLYGIAFVGVGLMYSVDDAAAVFALQVAVNIAFFPASALYPAFLGSALARSPAFLRTRAWLVGSIAFALVMDLVMVWRGDLVVAEVFRVPYAPYDIAPGPLMQTYLALAISVSLLGLVLSVRELRGSVPGSPARRRAALFLAAFGIQDALLAFGAIVVALVAVLPPDSWAFTFVAVAGFPIALTSASVLVGYGILRYQLFDIDVKIKLGLKRTTLAGIFLAIIFVVAQLVQAFAGIMFGAIAGAVAAGLLLVAIHPLQRMAERVSEAAMPRVRDTHEYRTVRKREVYLAAVESAMTDGSITDKERNVLATLADQLGLGVKETIDIEREAQGARGVA